MLYKGIICFCVVESLLRLAGVIIKHLSFVHDEEGSTYFDGRTFGYAVATDGIFMALALKLCALVLDENTALLSASNTLVGACCALEVFWTVYIAVALRKKKKA